MAQTDPAARHRFNGDEWMKEYADQLGVPPKTVRTDKEAAAMAQQEAQAQQAAAQLQMASMGAKTARDAAAAETEGPNVLTDIRDRLQAGGPPQ